MEGHTSETYCCIVRIEQNCVRRREMGLSDSGYLVLGSGSGCSTCRREKNRGRLTAKTVTEIKLDLHTRVAVS